MALARKVFAAATLCASAFVVPIVVAPAPAFAANTCRLPTQATPPSRFIKSYSNCNTCVSEAYKKSQNILGFRYYCTYNPSNNLNDLHQYLG
ncbi:hypothetical protein [Microtetraspora glauca]|uniref:Uncharacterized protein n=1 Tax=Microtetraspora glauca TaxID=1996 RepID=A0ABV3GA05_MICGL